MPGAFDSTAFDSAAFDTDEEEVVVVVTPPRRHGGEDKRARVLRAWLEAEAERQRKTLPPVVPDPEIIAEPVPPPPAILRGVIVGKMFTGKGIAVRGSVVTAHVQTKKFTGKAAAHHWDSVASDNAVLLLAS